MKDNYNFPEGTRDKGHRKDAIMRLPEAIAEIKFEAHATGGEDTIRAFVPVKANRAVE